VPCSTLKKALNEWVIIDGNKKTAKCIICPETRDKLDKILSIISQKTAQIID